MNIELIQKLIKLANNNPNENEANLAARKVCKLLTTFKFNETINIGFVRQPNAHYDPGKSKQEQEVQFRKEQQRANEIIEDWYKRNRRKA